MAHEILDLVACAAVALESLERRDTYDRGVVTREVILVEELTHLHLNQLKQLLVVDHVALVQRHDDLRHTDLAGQQHVLTSLGHRTVGGRHHEDRTVNLGSTGDHVLDVVGVARHVDMGIVPILGLVLDVAYVDRDTALTLLGSLIDVLELGELSGVGITIRQDLGDRRG